MNMVMEKNTLIGIIFAVAVVSPNITLAAQESTSDKTKQAAPIELQREYNQTLAHKMMGHINLARFALDIKLPDQASLHIKKAQNIEAGLATQLPELTINSSYKYGKVTYDDEKTIKGHYIPVVDDVFLISDYKEILKHSDELDLEETDAGIVHLGISVDLRDVVSGLAAAQKNIDNKEYDKAQQALVTIFENAIVDEEEIDDPTLAISENLSLARSFLSNDEYDSARFTLNHLQQRLKNLKTEGLPSDEKKSVAKLSTDLDNLQAELRKKDPTLTQSISGRLTQWGHDVKEWL